MKSLNLKDLNQPICQETSIEDISNRIFYLEREISDYSARQKKIHNQIQLET